MSVLDRALDRILDLDAETKERIKIAWRILKAFLWKISGVDYQIETGKDC